MKGSKPKEASKVCSRGHEFVKSREFPVCPKCWPGYYKKRVKGTKA